MAATTSSDITKTIPVVSGPVSAIDGVVNEVSSAFDNVGKQIKNITSTSILSALDAGIVQSDLELPIQNVLHNYASYTYSISLGCLSADMINYPGSSYMVGKFPPWICKSANADPNNRIPLAGGRKFDYYIDELKFTASTSFNSGTGNTNVNSMTFRIVEPYSMGGFLQAVQIAAANQSHPNWNGATYLLKIDFLGNKENGKMELVPDASRLITIVFSKWNMKATESGMIYEIEATGSNCVAFNDTRTNFISDVKISGTSVQEILQSGPNSLQQQLNARYKDMVDKKQVVVQDEILILFPKNIATQGTVALSSGETENKSSATTNNTQINDSKLFETLKVSRSQSSGSLIQNDGTCNELGKAALGFDVTRGTGETFSSENQVWDDKQRIWSKANNCPKPGTVDFMFSMGSDIINAINQVLLKSSIAATALDPKQMTKEGMRPWWRIEPYVYHINTDANMKTTGKKPTLTVYRVIPYQVHASNLLPPNAPAPGLKQLKKQVAKEYNYIYTGKNIDVLRFEIELSQMAYTQFAADNFERSGAVKAQSKASVVENKDVSEVKVGQGGSIPTPGQQATQASHTQLVATTDNKGGAKTAETVESRAAKLFHDTLTSGNDMNTITMDIIGDPYYISSSGSGNYTNTQTTLINVTKDGSMNYVNGEVHITINFRTPIDINQSTGLYDFSNTSLCQQFSGLFRVNNVHSEFKSGQFKQTIEASRIQGQDSKDEPNPAGLFSTEKIPLLNTGMQVMADIGDALSGFAKDVGLTPDVLGKVASTIKDVAEKTDSVLSDMNKGRQ
jgi:hypothetical protein